MFSNLDDTSTSPVSNGDQLRSLREALKSAQEEKPAAALSPAALMWTALMMGNAPGV